MINDKKIAECWSQQILSNNWHISIDGAYCYIKKYGKQIGFEKLMNLIIFSKTQKCYEFSLGCSSIYYDKFGKINFESIIDYNVFNDKFNNIWIRDKPKIKKTYYSNKFTLNNLKKIIQIIYKLKQQKGSLTIGNMIYFGNGDVELIYFNENNNLIFIKNTDFKLKNDNFVFETNDVDFIIYND